MPDTTPATREARRFGGGSGAQRGRQRPPAGRRDRGRAERALELRADLRQRRLDGRHGNGARRAQGGADVSAPDQARGLVRSIVRRTQRCSGRARDYRRDARWRRAERSLVHSGVADRIRARRSDDRAGRRPARRAPLGCVEESAVAHRQRRAQRHPARRHARHRLRPESVSAATHSWRCLISTGCIVFCPRCSGATVSPSAMST